MRLPSWSGPLSRRQYLQIPVLFPCLYEIFRPFTPAEWAGIVSVGVARPDGGNFARSISSLILSSGIGLRPPPRRMS